jgi:alpha-beta hydrolase superfamily lysophospholipase
MRFGFSFPAWRRVACATLLALLAPACVSFPDAPQTTAPPALADNALRSMDGAQLGLQSWPAEEPKAIILALHGMNDYSGAFALAGPWWAEHAQITTYALDQRGFGRSPDFGRWAGGDTLIADLRAALAAIHSAHPGLPVFVVGHSMGAAVVMAAQAEAPLAADGLVLAAPGVWGGRALPFPYRLTLNMAASFAPGKTLTGERTERQATDNIDILRAMYRDPLVIKQTRLDAVLGVVRIMGRAYGEADKVDGDILFLIGEKDEIIPLKAMEKAARRLSGETEVRRYEEGWHLLFRDKQAETVWRDVAAWIDARSAAIETPRASLADRPAAFQSASAILQTAR